MTESLFCFVFSMWQVFGRELGRVFGRIANAHVVWGVAVALSVVLAVLLLWVTRKEGLTEGAGPGTKKFLTGPTDKFKWRPDPGVGKDSKMWPKQPPYDWWDPYALAVPGQAVTKKGEISTEFGKLPVVDPPASKRGSPYFLDPLWQDDGTQANDYYAKNCKHLMKLRGTLGYQGPFNMCDGGACFPQAGAYVWSVVDPGPEGFPPNSTRVGASRMRSEMQMQGWQQAAEEDAASYLENGEEMPPWYRGGPFAPYGLAAMKKTCPNLKTPKPKRKVVWTLEKPDLGPNSWGAWKARNDRAKSAKSVS